MARVALAEVVLQYTGTSALAHFARDAEVYVYERGTEEEADLFAAETGGEPLTQPLTTDKGGQVKVENEYVWVEVGSYDLAVNEQTVPWEAVSGAEE